MPIPPPYPSFREALLFWFKLGFISFGGPAGQIAIMHEYLVEKKKWISEHRFMHALNYCMVLPGPEAQQLATYSGWLLHGTRGGLAAGILFILPSAFMLWLLSFIYVTYGSTPVITSMFDFLKPAVVAIILTAMIKMGKKSLSSPLHYLMAVIAFGMIYLLNTPFPFIIILALLTGTLFTRLFPGGDPLRFHVKEEPPREASAYVIDNDSNHRTQRYSWKTMALSLLSFALLWLIPLVMVYRLAPFEFSFFENLCYFFTKAAFVTFGGAYAVLPYVAQVSVETLGWLTKYQMMDGLALGETTPGPLIMVLSFVGFMAGYNHFDGHIGMATVGLVLSTYYTFLPSFLFILAGAPLIERTQNNKPFKAILSYVTAAVTGVILNLGLFFGQAVIMPSPKEILWIPLIWIAISFIALHIRKINLITWIGVSLGVGIIKFILQAI